MYCSLESMASTYYMQMIDWSGRICITMDKGCFFFKHFSLLTRKMYIKEVSNLIRNTSREGIYL